ncbi:MAG: amidinotransferase [Planctomycetaceae bacterium]|nr:amidinotransferase [Planctomycetaceae bacterium]
MAFDRPTILMCPPDFYGIEYEINPWMSRSRSSDSTLAGEQWQALHDLLISLNADVRLMTPVKGLPDLVFTANAGLIHRSSAYLSRFRHPARQGETSHDEEWFAANGFRCATLPDGMNFEGAGDALFVGDTLFSGYAIRSDVPAMEWVAGEIRCRVIPLQLVDQRFYHLDTCFCPLRSTEVIAYLAAFDDYAQKVIKEHIETIIQVADEEAIRFACNAVVLGEHVVLNTGCPKLESDLRDLGYEPHATSLDEFIKAGGSAKCLTLRLDGEDSAAWRNELSPKACQSGDGFTAIENI